MVIRINVNGHSRVLYGRMLYFIPCVRGAVLRQFIGALVIFMKTVFCDVFPRVYLIIKPGSCRISS